jgi:predicted flap endonuclease-1-like 5' DNA nuclease
VTQLEGTDEATALEQARARLEAALNGNEHWRALRRGAGDPGLEGHERALAGNPLYKSWKVVNDGLESLRRASDPEPAPGELASDVAGDAPADDLTRIRGISADLARRINALGVTRYDQIAAWRSGDVRKVAEALGLGRAISRQNWIEQAALLVRRAQGTQIEAAPRPASVAVPSIPVAATQAAPPAQSQRPAAHQDPEGTVDPPEDVIDLPDILERIRSDAAARGDALPTVSLDTEAVPQHGPDEAEVEEIEPEEPAKPEPAPFTTATADAPPAGAPSPVQRSPIPTVAASSHVNTDAAERAKRLEDDRRRLSESAERGLGPDEAEATVTFVIQEPVLRAPQTTDAPAVRGEHRQLPSDALSRLGLDQRAPTEAFVPPSKQAKEAEVVIVSAEGAGPAGRRTGSVRRFLRALTGS